MFRVMFHQMGMMTFRIPVWEEVLPETAAQATRTRVNRGNRTDVISGSVLTLTLTLHRNKLQ